MSSVVRRYLLEQVAGAAVINGAINGLVPWFLFRRMGLEALPLFGPVSVFLDTVGTTLIMPFAVCFTLSLVTEFKMARGVLPGLEHERYGRGIARRLPKNLLLRSVVVALACTLICVPLVLLPFLAFGVTEVGLLAFCTVKALLAALLAAALVHPLTMRVLTTDL